MPKLNRGDLHATYRWRNAVSPLIRQLNPICQFVEKSTGRQCTHASEICHHLIDPKVDPNLFFDFSNIVALCVDHHSGGQVGDTQHYTYVHTIGPAGAVYPHGYGFPSWHRDFKPRPNPLSGEATLLPPGSSCSAVGDDLLDRALADSTI